MPNKVWAVVLVTSATTVSLYIFWRLRRNARNNPFNENAVIEMATPSRVPRSRRKVLRNHLEPSELESDFCRSYDVICIGSGVSSLIASAILAKSGKKVLVLEQHAKLGGGCHTFKEGNFEFDTGFHFASELDAGSMNFKLLEQLCEGQLCWRKLDDQFDEIVLRKDGKKKNEMKIIMESTFEGWKETMLRTFPDEEVAIDEFITIIKKCLSLNVFLTLLKLSPRWLATVLKKVSRLKYFRRWTDFLTKPAVDLVEEITENEELRACFLSSWGYIATPPNRCPVFAVASTLGRLISSGTYYPVNGPSSIAYYLNKTILKNGGNFYTKACANEILIRRLDNNKMQAYGVLVRCGPSASIQFLADTVISGVGLFNTYRNLIPRHIVDQYCPEANWLLNRSEPGISFFNVFIGLSDTKANLKLPARNTWLYDGLDYSELFTKWVSEPDPFTAIENFGVPILYVTFPCAKDPNYSFIHQDVPATCIAVTFVPYRWFRLWDDCPERKQDDKYEALKDKFSVKIWDRIVETFPQLKDKRELLVVGTPVTHSFYLKTYQGQISGINHSSSRFDLDFVIKCRPQTEISNLFLTGQDIWFCGNSPAMNSGLMTASSILNRSLAKDLERLYRKLR